MGKVTCKNCGEKVRVKFIGWGYRTKCKNCDYMVNLNQGFLMWLFNAIFGMPMLIGMPFLTDYVIELTGAARWQVVTAIIVIFLIVVAPIQHFLSCFIYDKGKVKPVHYADTDDFWDLDKQNPEAQVFGRRYEEFK